jgi:hypothetical protein
VCKGCAGERATIADTERESPLKQNWLERGTRPHIGGTTGRTANSKSPFAIRALSDILKPSDDPPMPSPKRQPATKPFVPLTIQFDHALLFAAQVHRNQDRKRSGIPYLSHLLGVAAIVLDYGGDEDLGIAALLHDAAEDHGGRAMLRSIEQLFGPRVAKIVDGCTDSYGDDEKSKPKWYPRKLRYLRRVRHEDAETRFVSAADKLYNTRAILRDLRQSGESAFDRFSAPKVKVLWYYRSLVREYRAGGVTHLLKPLLDDYDRAVTELEHLSGLLAAPNRAVKPKTRRKR